MHELIITVLVITGLVNVVFGLLYIFLRKKLFKHKSSDSIDELILNHVMLRKRDFFTFGISSLLVAIALYLIVKISDPLLFFVYYILALLIIFISILINLHALLFLFKRKNDKLILVVAQRKLFAIVFLTAAPIIYAIMIALDNTPISDTQEYERLFQITLVMMALIVFPIYQYMVKSLKEYHTIRIDYENLLKSKSSISNDLYLKIKKRIFNKYLISKSNDTTNENKNNFVVDFLNEHFKNKLVSGMSGQIVKIGTDDCSLTDRVGSVYGVVIDIPDSNDLEFVFKEYNENTTLNLEDWLPIKGTLYPLYWGMDINLGKRLLAHATTKNSTTGAIRLNNERYKNLDRFDVYYGTILVSDYSDCEQLLHQKYKSLLSKTVKKGKQKAKKNKQEDQNND